MNAARVIVSAMLAFLLGGTDAYSDIVGIPTVIDADTLEIDAHRIRLFGIDAPESAQFCQKGENEYRCGQEAALALDELVQQKSVRCIEQDIDRYHRIVGTCFLGSLNLNQWLVENGHAVAYRQYSHDYVAFEEAAKAAKVGIWASAFKMPWLWRKDRRSSHKNTTAAPTTHCRIKGNISKSGKVYHVPGGRWYEATNIDSSKGERWFCTEDEAISAGWKRSNQ